MATDKDRFPYIVFHVADNLFCVNSVHVAGIIQLQEYTPIPSAPRQVRGMMKYRDSVVTLFDLRGALNMGSLEEQYDQFCHMIDQRKQDHERWVRALEDTIQNGAPFTLATDPHQCALGKWRDSFHSEIGEVNFQLNQLDNPHASLHHSALEILDLQSGEDTPASRRAIAAIFDHVKNTYMPTVLSMLEDMKHVFRACVFREMILLLNGRENLGIIVENVHSVENLSNICDAKVLNQFANFSYITSVKRSEKVEGLILELDMAALVDQIADFKPPVLP